MVPFRLLKLHPCAVPQTDFPEINFHLEKHRLIELLIIYQRHVRVKKLEVVHLFVKQAEFHDGVIHQVYRKIQVRRGVVPLKHWLSIHLATSSDR
jgi:hypothetical protein